MTRKSLSIVIIISSFTLLMQAQVRKPGIWKQIKMLNGPGRITDVELDPNDGNRLYCAPDGDGIWYTKDLGKHWECITKNIPEVQDRVSDKDFMVDPTDFNTIYYVAVTGAFYITHNQGTTWERVKDKKGLPVQLTDFKRSRLAKQTDGSMTMVCTSIGRMHAEKGTWPMGLHVSNDGGITWQNFPNPSKEEMFLEIEFHPTNPQIIYAPTNLRLYKSIDAGKTFNPVFDFTGASGGNANVSVSPFFPDYLWLVSGGDEKKIVKRKDKKTGKEEDQERSVAHTAIYQSTDAGKSWKTLQDSKNGIGFNKSIFDNAVPGSWLNNFVVNPQNPDIMLAALDRMMETSDGAKTWQVVQWWVRRNQQNSDGTIERAKLSHHSADNQNIKFHPAFKNRVFRCCDAGLFLRDPENGFEEWTSITGNIGNSLMYSVITNEFGDEKIIEGNSQDVDIQVFFNNTWQYDRGYEGDAIVMNPFSNISNYPYAPSGELQNIEPYGANISSWGKPAMYANYFNPDEQYLKWVYSEGNKKGNTVSITENRGRTWRTMKVPYRGSVQFLAVSRTLPVKIFAFAKDSMFVTSDTGNTWISKSMPKKDVNFGTIDPANPQKVWICTSKNVFFSENEGQTWDSINTGLPNDSYQKILFHEGTAGDLYLLTNNNGVYFMDASSKKWTPWIAGFYLPSFNDITIDYQRQKLLGASYGSGVWEADLTQPCERFVNAKASIKQLTQVGNKSVFALDIPFNTPSYYKLNWYKGSTKLSDNWFFNALDVKVGDTISCTAKVQHSPDIALIVAPYIVKQLPARANIIPKNGLLFDSISAKLGWSDLYKADSSFTVSIRTKPMSNGVLIANRNWNDFDAKGWVIGIDNNELVVKTNALSNLVGVIEKGGSGYTVQPTEKLRVPIQLNLWQTIKMEYNVSSNTISIYINNKLAGRTAIPVQDYGHSLNSIMDLTVGSDALGYRPIKAEIQEVKIWNAVMSNVPEVKSKVKKVVPVLTNEQLVIFANFDNATNYEYISGKIIKKQSVKR